MGLGERDVEHIGEARVSDQQQHKNIKDGLLPVVLGNDDSFLAGDSATLLFLLIVIIHGLTRVVGPSLS